MMTNSMRLLVHFHVYYLDHVDYFIGKMRNINSCRWDLVVTAPYIDEATESKIKSFKPDAIIEHVDNEGYDIWPFIHVVEGIDLSQYDCILKLHTKGSIPFPVHFNGLVLRGFMWRDALVDALLETPEVFRSNLEIFAARPNVGMVFSDKLYIKSDFREDGVALIKEMRRLGFRTCHRRFCAGTMFMVRAAALKYLTAETVQESMFQTQLKSHSNGSMAHIYERILTLAVLAQGYKVQTVGVPMMYMAYFRLKRWGQPILSFLLSIERHGPKMIKYLTILGIRIPLDSGISRKLLSNPDQGEKS